MGIDKTRENNVYSVIESIDSADKIEEKWTRQDAIEFFSMLRCAFLQVVRWIERKYPESVK